MADETLTIREIVAPGQSSRGAPAVFEFTAQERSLPEGDIPWPIALRTKRTDYPGNDGAPTVQILGWNYEPIELEGEWDDRFMGAGQSEDTVRRFESMLKRGRKVELQHGRDAMVCLVVEFVPRKLHKARWHWSIKLEPFDRTTGREVRPLAEGRQDAVLVRPDDAWNDIALAYDAAYDYHANAPQIALTLDAHARVGASLGRLGSSVTVMADAIELRAGSTASASAGSSPVDALRRVASAAEACAAEASAVMAEFSEMEEPSEVAWDDPVAELEFETWRCGTAFNARLALTRSLEASDQLKARVDPSIIAVHRAAHGENLQALAWRYYGDPTMWDVIASRNRLGYLTLQGGELLIIPAGHA